MKESNDACCFFSHNDLANNLYLLENNTLIGFNFTDLSKNDKWIDPSNEYGSHTDLTRLYAGKVRGQVRKIRLLRKQSGCQ